MMRPTLTIGCLLAVAIALAQNPVSRKDTYSAHNVFGNNTGSSAAAAPVQLACGDLSNAASSCSTDATNAANIGSGSLGIARTTHYGAFVSKGTSTNVNNSTDTILSFTTTVRDDCGCFTGGSSDRLTIPTGGDGWWIVTAQVRWDSNATGGRYVHIKKNGSFVDWTSSVGAPSNGSAGVNVSVVAYLVATDFLEIDAFQDSGGARNVNDSQFSLTRVN